MTELIFKFPRCTLYLAIHAALNPAGNRELSGFWKDDLGNRLPWAVEGEYLELNPSRKAGRPANPSRQVAIFLMHLDHRSNGEKAGSADTAIVEAGFFSDERAVTRSRQVGKNTLTAWKPGLVLIGPHSTGRLALVFRSDAFITPTDDSLLIEGHCWRWDGGDESALDYITAKATIPDPAQRQQLVAAFREGVTEIEK